MKHYFVVNPKSGKNETIDFVNDLIIPAAEKTGIEYEIYETAYAGDGTRFVKETAAAANGAPVRFYAVGGDGTLYEIINGAYGFENAEVAVLPKGSGNDWIRLFGDIDLFRDVEGLINGVPTKMDCIKVTTDNSEEIAINQTSMGFDAEACSEQGKMKSVPGAVGHITYLLAGLMCCITRVKHDFDVEVDGKKIEGPFIQVTGCNSRWYGSGIKVAPFAMPTDHMLDFVILRRTAFWPMLFKYMMVNWQVKGTHWKASCCEYLRGKKVTCKSVNGKSKAINVDGECHPVTEMTLEVVEDGLTFVIPKNSTYFEDVKNGILNNDIQQTWKNKDPWKTIRTKYDPYNIFCNMKYRRK